MGFIDDVRAGSDVVREVVRSYSTQLDPLAAHAADLLVGQPDRLVLVVGMGSSLAAGRVLTTFLAERSRLAVAEDAGELLHYGYGSLNHAGIVVAISQSGRSIETLRLVERIRAERDVPLIAIVNDLDSPLAGAADLALPMLAGNETAVATRTYVASVALLLALAARAFPDSIDPALFERTAAAMEHAGTDLATAKDAADLLEPARALMVVGRGPSLGTAQYAALTLKETIARPAEAMSGGAFRHGPLELAGAGIGVIVLAPDGPTAALGSVLACEIAAAGCPTWLLAGPRAAADIDASPGLLVTALPALPEPLASLASVVPLQLVAAELAGRAGRQAGTTTLATKVTERE